MAERVSEPSAISILSQVATSLYSRSLAERGPVSFPRLRTTVTENAKYLFLAKAVVLSWTGRQPASLVAHRMNYCLIKAPRYISNVSSPPSQPNILSASEDFHTAMVINAMKIVAIVHTVRSFIQPPQNTPVKYVSTTSRHEA